MIFYWVQMEWFCLKQARLVALVDENRLVFLEKQNDWADRGEQAWIDRFMNQRPVE